MSPGYDRASFMYYQEYEVSISIQLTNFPNLKNEFQKYQALFNCESSENYFFLSEDKKTGDITSFAIPKEKVISIPWAGA